LIHLNNNKDGKDMNSIKVGIIGFGTVGAGVASALLTNSDVMERRTGVKAELARIADLDITSDRGVEIPPGILTTDVNQLIDDVDVVVELVGGIDHAKKFIAAALEKGKPVVTANKALIAKLGEELFAIAEKSGTDIYYEASVAGGIPVIKALKEGLVANRITRIVGILNGTCNYILTKMEKESVDFDSVLAEAQELGYAEADPSLDIDGFDTAHKTAILASLAYGEWFGTDPVFVEGIRGIELTDIKYAMEMGYKIKLLGIIKQENHDVQIRVHPTLIPQDTLLAGISSVFNGVLITGDYAGDSLYYGQGAGRDATASSVVADIMDVALNQEFGSHRRVPDFRTGSQFGKVIEMDDVMSRYYIRLQVIDKPKVVASVSEILGNQNISISSIMQSEESAGEEVPLLILTHFAKEGDINTALEEIQALECVHGTPVKIRIEDI
jgi:homoserine dehydrogenase